MSGVRLRLRLRVFAGLTVLAVSPSACTSPDQHVTPGGTGGAGGGGLGGGGSGSGGSAAGSGGSGDARVTAAPHPLAIAGQEAVIRVAKVLWQTMPDTDLLGRAAGLRSREDVNLLALDMLKDPRARAGVGAFYRSWLWLDKEEIHSTYPEWTAEVKADVATAVELFAVNVTLDMNGSFRTLLTAPFTYANERLARFYGIPGVTGTDFQKVAVDPKQRGGLLSQPSLMARVPPQVTGPPGTNPPMRGRIIRNKFYCVDLSPIHMPVIPPHPELSNRQFFATVTAGISGNVPCVTCHYGFELNALGFPFEGFDDLGRARTVDDRKHPLDLKGMLQNGLGAEASYDGPVELSAILAENPEVQTCFGSYWSGFARGLPLADSPLDTDSSIQVAFTGADLNLRALIAAVVSSETFLAAAGSNPDGGAAGRGESDGSDAGVDADTPPANCSVPAILSKHSCTGLCHASSVTPVAGGGFDMVTPGWEKKLVGTGPPSTAPETNACKGRGLNYLNKTQPATGLFLDKLKPTVPCGQAMPIIGGALSPGELACVQTWADGLAASAP